MRLSVIRNKERAFAVKGRGSFFVHVHYVSMRPARMRISKTREEKDMEKR